MGMILAKRFGVPSIASFHLDMARITTFYRLGFLRRPVARLSTWVFNRANYALAPSRSVQREMLAAGVRQVGWWRRGVDAEQFHPSFRDAAMRDLLSDGHPDDIILLYVGRLAVEKQIQQIRSVLDTVPGTRLALVGGGPYQSELEKHFAGYPVKFAGYMHGATLSRAYASADIFTFPSAFESFGLVLLEAMASGLPLVSSRVGGAQDLVTEGVSGYTFDVDDVASMVEQVRTMVCEPGRLRRMGLAAREAAERQSWPHIMDELIDCYEAVLAGRPSPI
ncbi:MAG TPA: glycosyltransferase, partial [Aggregatilineales bacterium]|nr:glycosyltransferase [Aggregatilineales bacterium]